MTGPLPLISLALAAMGMLMVAVLVARRVVLAIGERRRRRLEDALQPVALDIIDGEIDPTVSYSRRESRALALIVARYSRQLAGEARANVAEFFEGRGYVDREIRNLRARRAWRRASAAFTLGDMASPRAVRPLLDALDDSRRDVRSAAARSLGLLGASEAVPRLIDCLVTRAIPTGVGGFALLTLGTDARGELRGLVGHEDAAVRSTAAELLGYVGTPADASLLITLLRDLSGEVRSAAAGALGRVGAESAAVALRATLEDRLPYVRAATAEALGAIDDIDATKLLVRQAESDLFEPARAAARALATIDPDEAIAQGQIPGAGPHLLNAAALAELGR
jgi:HEAT repeat protein